MGPTSSGKTTLSLAITSYLRKKGEIIINFDGDEIRDLLGKDLGFKSSDRLKVVETLAYLANKSTDAGANVIVSALTAYQDARTYIKENVKGLLIVQIECSLDTCIKRDPKGLYKRSISGEIDTLIGFDTTYSPPDKPDLILNTEINTLNQNLKMFINYYNIVNQ